ncbi:hypothetical protein SRHO_G00227050 [Serrasalmus rhombeus]
MRCEQIQSMVEEDECWGGGDLLSYRNTSATDVRFRSTKRSRGRETKKSHILEENQYHPTAALSLRGIRQITKTFSRCS